MIEVTHIDDKYAPTEKAGIEYLHKCTNYPFWVQTFKDRSKRKKYAAKGFTYDEKKDAFISIQPFDSWTLNEDTCLWEAPVIKPDDGKRYNWNEEITNWEEIV